MVESSVAARVLDALAGGDAVDACALGRASAHELGDGALDCAARAALAALEGRPEAAFAEVARCVSRAALPPAAAVGLASAIDRPKLAADVDADLLARGGSDPWAPHMLRAYRFAASRPEALAGGGEDVRTVSQLTWWVELLDARPDWGDADEVLQRHATLALDDADLGRRVLDRHLAAGELAAVRRDADAYQRRHPDSAHPWRARAAAFVLEGDLAAAGDAIDEALARDGDDEVTRTWAMEIAQRCGDADAARSHEHVAQAQGMSFPRDVLRGLALAQQGHRFADAASMQLDLQWLTPANLRPWLGEDTTFARWVADAELRVRTLTRIRDDLGGCRSHPVTRRTSGGVERVPLEPPARLQASTALMALPELGPSPVRARLDALVRAYPDSPHPRCYRGELSLWEGAYDDAAADFEAAAAIAPTRWAYVGAGAVRLLRGDLDAAAADFDRADAFGRVPGATTHVYRGELRLALGERQAAAAELAQAVRARPGRVGAWILLALVDPDDAGAMKAVRTLAPAVLATAAHSLGVQPPRTGRDDRAAEVLRQCLWLMRGNRSSTLLTTVQDGELRVHAKTDRVARAVMQMRDVTGSATSPASWAVACDIARDLVRAPDLPAPLPVHGLSLTSVQRCGDALDLVLGRACPLLVLRLTVTGGRVRARAITPPHLSPAIVGAAGALARRLQSGISPDALAAALRRASHLPDFRGPL